MIRLLACFALPLALALVLPAAAPAQTLPQSTVDRQTIAQLQYELTQPGVTPQQKLVIQEQISQLEYQINTRPLIAPAPSPVPREPIPPGARIPFARPPAPQVPVAPEHYGYGSCDADRAMIVYLSAKLHDASLTQQERDYLPSQLRELQADLRARRC